MEPRFTDPPPAVGLGRGRPGVSRSAFTKPTARQPNRGRAPDDPEFACTACSQTKPIAEAHEVGVGDSKRRRTGWCKPCGQKKARAAGDAYLARKRGPDYVLPEIRDQVNPVIDGQRKCWVCSENKLIDEFYKEKTVASGYQSICIDCFLIRKRAAHLLRTYNITQARYDDMLTEQNGVCAICSLPETVAVESDREPALAVDHDHACCSGTKSCGECVRGLLCRRCNTMVGYARDNVDILVAGAEYLSRYQPAPPTTPWADPGHRAR